jgi:1,4-dihydroxy-2-naphthoyl-CoA hydrolase
MMLTPQEFMERGADKLPGLLDIVITKISATQTVAQIDVKEKHMAPNGYMHAGTVVTLADTTTGYGCIVNLPEGASGFTTVELKSNHLGTARSGVIESVATPVHIGRSTQVWDAVVTEKATGKILALFRCTQMILYPRT